MPVRERDLERGIAGNHTESVIDEMEVTNDFRAKHAGDVGSGGGAATRSDLFGDTAAAHDVAAFEDEGGVSRAREVGGSREAVVASADNNGVVNRVSTTGHAADRWSN